MFKIVEDNIDFKLQYVLKFVNTVSLNLKLFKFF